MVYLQSNGPRLNWLIPPVLKPPQICRAVTSAGGEVSDVQWAQVERTRIEAEVSSISLANKGLGTALQLRDARPDDLARVLALIERCFGTTFLACNYQVMWSLRCGRAAVIDTQERDLVGVHLETPAVDCDHSSYSIAACVDARARGFRLSGVLARYTGLRAFMEGARVRRGVVAPMNVGSCVVLLHEVGANFVRHYPSFADTGDARFEYALELSRVGLGAQRVDTNSLASWLDATPAGTELVPIDDYGRLASLFEDQRRRIVALCRERAAYVVVHDAPRLDAPNESRPSEGHR